MKQDYLLEDDNFDVLARHIVDAHYSKNPSLETAYGEQGKQKCHDDAVYHLTYLAQAVKSGSDALFTDYVIWAKGLLEGLNVPASHLHEHLGVMRDTLKGLLVQEQAQNTDRIIAAARSEIDQERQQVKEELRQKVASLAIAGAEQILAREVDEKAHKEVLDKISATL